MIFAPMLLIATSDLPPVDSLEIAQPYTTTGDGPAELNIKLFDLNSLIGPEPEAEIVVVDDSWNVSADFNDSLRDAMRAWDVRSIVFPLNDEAGNRICTGSAVVLGDEVGILTAAHCLWRMNAGGYRIDERTTLVKENEVLDLDAARWGHGFRDCRGRYDSCVLEDGASDIAFIPFAAATTWRTCSAAHAHDSFVAAFASGYSGAFLPSDPRRGIFSVRGEREYIAVGRSIDGSSIQVIDSGGPAVRIDLSNSSHPPEVCFVVSGRDENNDSFALFASVEGLR